MVLPENTEYIVIRVYINECGLFDVKFLQDFEKSGVFNGNEWTGMTLSEKNQWIRKFLIKTKVIVNQRFTLCILTVTMFPCNRLQADVVYVYNQVGEIMDSPSDGELMSDITDLTQISSVRETLPTLDNPF